MTLRADAARNRAAIVDAARDVFAEQGLDAPLDDIARRGGIGNATLYRRFPTRVALIEAVFAERMHEELAAVEAALADPDPWNGFASYVKAVCSMQARDRGIADLATMDVSRAPEIDAVRGRAFAGVVRLIERAQVSGVLRADVTTEDVVVLLMANAGLVERTHGISDIASARLVHLLLDGLRAASATDGPAAPAAVDTEEAMRRNSERRLADNPRKARAHQSVCRHSPTDT